MTFKEILDITDDKTLKEKLEPLVNECGLGSFRIKSVGNDSTTGFGVIVFTDGKGNTGFSFRGTDGAPSAKSINDWTDNGISAVTGTSPQTAQAETFFDKYKDTSENNYLYGHSKGGQLSESVYANNNKDIKSVHLLNPQPLNPYSLTADQKLAMQSDKVDIVIVEGDYVWFLGALPSYGNIRIAKSNGGDSHDYSSIYDIYDENGNIQETNQPWWEYAAYFTISTISSGLQRLGA